MYDDGREDWVRWHQLDALWLRLYTDRSSVVVRDHKSDSVFLDALVVRWLKEKPLDGIPNRPHGFVEVLVFSHYLTLAIGD